MGTVKEKIAGKKITVMGLGLHGGAVGNIEWLAKHGARILVTDTKNERELSDSLKKIERLKGVEYRLGGHKKADFVSADMVLVNPGVPRESEYLRAAERAGVSIEMDSGLFFEFCASEKIIGITGTKGKTTTSKIIESLLGINSVEVATIGVDGVSPLKKLDSINKETVVVFELSSWRLEALGLKRRSPHIAVVTSFYPDHLNTYDSLKDYEGAKKNIIKYQHEKGVAIINSDYEILRKWKNNVRGKIYWYGETKKKYMKEGVFLKNGKIIIYHEEKKIEMTDRALSLFFGKQKINLLPAIMISYLKGIGPGQIVNSLNLLKKPKERLEAVGTVDEVTYVNDTTATIPEATQFALDNLGGEKKIVLLLGGGDKGLCYDGLAEKIIRSPVKKIIFLPGEATKKIKKSLVKVADKRHLPFVEAKTMEEAVKAARISACPGEIVLLSPAATSFGLFKHEFDRGKKYSEAIDKIKNNN